MARATMYQGQPTPGGIGGSHILTQMSKQPPDGSSWRVILPPTARTSRICSSRDRAQVSLPLPLSASTSLLEPTVLQAAAGHFQHTNDTHPDYTTMPRSNCLFFSSSAQLRCSRLIVQRCTLGERTWLSHPPSPRDLSQRPRIA